MPFPYHPTHLTPQHRRGSLTSHPGSLALGAALLLVFGGSWLTFSHPPVWSPEQSAQISAARQAACQRSVTLRLGGKSFLAKPDQVCSWLLPVPQPTKQLNPQPLPKPQFNVDAITEWVHSCTSQVEKTAVNGKRQVDSAGRLVSLLKDPVNGATVDHPNSLVTQIKTALHSSTGHVKVAGKLSARHAGFDDTVVADPPLTYHPQPNEKWVDVNLTTHTLAAYEGDKLVMGPVPVVHGPRLAPTVQGVFKIYSRVPFQDMTGIGFDGPYSEPANYIQYFHKGFALHPAPWRTSFVYTPDTGSHGCVNMRPDDAKWMWDWADTNTTVVTHP